MSNASEPNPAEADQRTTTNMSMSDSVSYLDDTDLESALEVLSIASPQSLRAGIDDQLPMLDMSPTYVYYRLYSSTKALPSKYRIYADDQYIGRIDANRIPPPHNAHSIKQCIVSHEEIVEHPVDGISLFSAVTSAVPMSDGDLVPIMAGTGSGSTPQEPVALVIMDASPSGLVNANNSIKDGTYLVRNPDRGCFWKTDSGSISLHVGLADDFRSNTSYQWTITHTGNRGILLQSRSSPSLYAARALKTSTTPIPWRFIAESYGSKLYHFTTDMTNISPKVATAPQSSGHRATWSKLRMGNKLQLWELIPV